MTNLCANIHISYLNYCRNKMAVLQVEHAMSYEKGSHNNLLLPIPSSVSDQMRRNIRSNICNNHNQSDLLLITVL